MRTYDLELPSGNHITFREPRHADRQKVLAMLKPEDTLSVDEALAAECIVAINGNPLRDPDSRRRFNPWTIKDTQTYLFLFLQMFTLSQDNQKDLAGKARALLGLEELPPSESGTGGTSGSEPALS